MNTNHLEEDNTLSELSLTDAVSSVLSAAGHPNPTAWKKHLDPEAANVTDPIHEAFYIRRCLSKILSHSGDKIKGLNTLNERLCVVQDTNRSDWVRLFTKGVAPCMVKHNLPV